MTSFVRSSSGTINASGQNVAQINDANIQPTLHLSGTLVGTVQLVGAPTGSGNFQPIIPLGQTTPNITASGLYAFPFIGGSYDFQVTSTAFTSGSSVATISFGPRT